MALRVIEQYKAGMVPKFRYNIGNDIKQVMINKLIYNKKINRIDHKMLSDACKKLYEYNHWIQCDCINSDDKPIFRFKRSPGGTLYIYRLSERASHNTKCPFKESDSSSVSSQKKNKRYRVFTELTGPLNLLSKKTEGISSATRKPSNSSPSLASRPTHKLAKVLYEILDRGGLNKFSTKESLPLSKCLEKGVEGLDIVSNRQLKDFIYYSISGMNHLCPKLKKSYNWPKNIPKQGLLLAKVKSFKGNTLEVICPKHPKDSNADILSFNVENKIYQWSGRYSERTGPYMAIILVTEISETPHEFIPFNAFLMPVYSASGYMPIDSYYERIVLKRLYAIGFDYKKRKQYLEIIKPVKDILVLDDEGQEHYVLPDFIIEASDKTLVIEVNGSHEPEYLERKQRTHCLMEKVGKVLSFDAYGEEKKGALDNGLNMFIRNIKEEIGC